MVHSPCPEQRFGQVAPTMSSGPAPLNHDARLPRPPPLPENNAEEEEEEEEEDDDDEDEDDDEEKASSNTRNPPRPQEWSPSGARLDSAESTTNAVTARRAASDGFCNGRFIVSLAPSQTD